MNFFLAPIYSLFSLNFYRKLVREDLAKGILYLLYLSALATVIAALLFVQRGLPEVSRFMDWTKSQMPGMTFTQDGLEIDRPSPYAMQHPQLGALAIFDTAKVEISTDAMGGALIFVTAKKMYVKQTANQVRIYDLTRDFSKGQAAQKPYAVTITQETIDKFYAMLKPWFFFFGGFLFFIFFFIWKLFAALFYSWFGLLINFLRRPKLNYGTIFNVSAFALTPVTVIQGLRLFIPALARLPFGFLGGLLVTLVYLFFAIKKTEEDSSESAESSTPESRGL